MPNAKTAAPTFIFNKDIIGNGFLFKDLGSSEQEIMDKVNEISVLHGRPTRKNSDFYNLTEQGIVFLELKEAPKHKTQSELNEFFGMDNRNDIYMDGYLIESKNYGIALNGITEIEIVEPDTLNGLGQRVLNIWTIKKGQRYREHQNDEK